MTTLDAVLLNSGTTTRKPIARRRSSRTATASSARTRVRGMDGFLVADGLSGATNLLLEGANAVAA
jgi:hypothetical protein